MEETQLLGNFLNILALHKKRILLGPDLWEHLAFVELYPKKNLKLALSLKKVHYPTEGTEGI